MRRTRILIPLLAALLVAAPQVSMADRGYGGHYGGGVPWWWIVPPLILLSTLPAYRYPDPEPVIIQPAPPAQVIAQPPPMTAPYPQAAMPQAAQSWYYCPASNGYYPYVTACPGGWQQVPSTPPGVGP